MYKEKPCKFARVCQEAASPDHTVGNLQSNWQIVKVQPSTAAAIKMLGFLPVVICKRTTCITAAIFGVAATSKPHLSYILRTAAGATLSSSTDRQQQGITPSAFSTRSGADDVKHISSTSPEAVTSKGEDGSQGEAGHPVFTGTADVYTNRLVSDLTAVPLIY